ncbi:MAG: hypothetical protein ABS76_29390 [Pelagibacterium sp. SCN 64-44]|nr:MAG: hypothetical protein ABS76_29390 [Pelagibacterium sp. SCN 64-44]
MTGLRLREWSGGRLPRPRAQASRDASRDAFALEGFCDDAARLGTRLVGLHLTQLLGKLDDVVAIDHMHLPAESAPFLVQRLDGDDVIDLAVELVAIAIDNGDDVGKRMAGSVERRFPDLPFLHLAVAEQHEDVEILALDARAMGHADAIGKGMADGAGAEIDAGHLAHVGVVAQGAAEARIIVQPFGREKIEIGEDREQPHRRMALAHQEAVAIRPIGLAASDIHDIVIERGEDFGAGEN